MEIILKKLLIISTTAIALSACTTTGNVEKNTAIGTAAGAAAGAVIGNNVGKGDAKTGAIIGGVAGAVGGAVVGRQKDQTMGEGTKLRKPAFGQRMYYDQAAGRYYFIDEETGKTYWQNGALRTN
ncbi:MAG: glycine zipper 2TM domain-containing protein [Acidimicrobiales bacterium]|nr:glycine zipper 2TM domain-containing protein [Hyphomonadaceae bacterium]RZV35272.1 MAG: glycine zipper 2TM domain-containing protein [Acidimicrobiales bacterium]